MKLTDFKALTFDCYGTLIDWERGMINGLKPLTDRLAQPLSRDQILEAHAQHESGQQAYTPEKPYFEILAIVYKRLAEMWQLSYSGKIAWPMVNRSSSGPPLLIHPGH